MTRLDLVTKPLIMLFCVLSLMASGGGGGTSMEPEDPDPLPPDPEPVTIDPDYLTLESSSGTSVFGGTAIITADPLELAVLSGSLDHASGVLTISSGGTVLYQGPMPDGQERATDSDGRELRLDTVLDGSGSSFALTGTAYPGAVTNAFAGGLLTLADDMPLSGAAVYNGQASVAVITNDGAYDLSGSASLTADFASSVARADLSGLSGSTGAPSAPIDQVVLPELSIAGASMTGTVVETYLNGKEVVITGTSPDSEAAGQFLGLLSNGVPAEATGGFVTTGPEGSAAGMFLAE